MELPIGMQAEYSTGSPLAFSTLGDLFSHDDPRIWRGEAERQGPNAAGLGSCALALAWLALQLLDHDVPELRQNGCFMCKDTIYHSLPWNFLVVSPCLGARVERLLLANQGTVGNTWLDPIPRL